jgi:hypothetical protein
MSWGFGWNSCKEVWRWHITLRRDWLIMVWIVSFWTKLYQRIIVFILPSIRSLWYHLKLQSSLFRKGCWRFADLSHPILATFLIDFSRSSSSVIGTRSEFQIPQIYCRSLRTIRPIPLSACWFFQKFQKLSVFRWTVSKKAAWCLKGFCKAGMAAFAVWTTC